MSMCNFFTGDDGAAIHHTRRLLLKKSDMFLQNLAYQISGQLLMSRCGRHLFDSVAI